MATTDEIRGVMQSRNIKFSTDEALVQCTAMANELGLSADALANEAEAVLMKTPGVPLTPDILMRVRKNAAKLVARRSKAGHMVSRAPTSLGVSSAPAAAAAAAVAATGFEAAYNMPVSAAPMAPTTPVLGQKRGLGSTGGASTVVASRRRHASMTPGTVMESATRSAPMSTGRATTTSESPPNAVEAYEARTTSGSVVASIGSEIVMPEGSFVGLGADANVAEALEEGGGDEVRGGVVEVSKPFEVCDTVQGPGVLAVKSANPMYGAGTLLAPERYMFTPPSLRADAIEARVGAIVDEICEATGLDEDTFAPVISASQDPVTVAGRICADVEAGGTTQRLAIGSVVLEGERSLSQGRRVALNLKDIGTFSVFPGMVAVLQGMNSRGEELTVRRMYAGSFPPPSLTPVRRLERVARLAEAKSSGPLRVIAAAGPFCLHDDANLSYDPLRDLCAELADAKAGPAPDLLVLTGPFLDANHPSLRRGRPQLRTETGVMATVTLEELWEIRILPVLQELLEQRPCLRIVLVPHTTDLLAAPVFPQPPLSPSVLATVEDPAVRQRISLVGNPATFQAGGVTFGTVGADPLFDISARSVFKHGASERGDRLPRVARHLLEQRSYYPLFPADPNVPLDLAQYPYVEMPVAPDILLLPSKLKPILHKIDDATLLVCPGTLTKAKAPGTFARLHIRPIHKKDILPVHLPESDTPETESEAKPPTPAVLDTAAVRAAAAEASETVAIQSIPSRTFATIVRI